jgi:hypothetical protein
MVAILALRRSSATASRHNVHPMFRTRAARAARSVNVGHRRAVDRGDERLEVDLEHR